MPNHLFLRNRHLTPDKSNELGPSSRGLAQVHYLTSGFPQGKTDPGVEFEFVDSDEIKPEEDDVLYCMECGQPLTRRDDKCPWCGEYQ